MQHPSAKAMPDTDMVGPFPLIAAQTGIWMAEQLTCGDGFAVAHCTQIDGALDEDLFAQAVRQALFEADTLHLRFEQTDDGPRQTVVLPPSVHEVPAISRDDLRAMEAPELAAQSRMRKDLENAPRLEENEPLFCHKLFRVGPQRWFWYQRYHHIAVDGYSIGQIARRVGAIYAARLAGRPIGPAPFTPFGDVVAEYTARDGLPDQESDRNFWLTYTSDKPAPPSLAGALEAASLQLVNFSVVRRYVTIPAALAARFAAVGRQDRLGPTEAVTAGILAYLHRMTGSEELALGVPFMRRLGSAAAQSSAAVVNVLPVYLRANRDSTLTTLCSALAAELRTIRRHQRYSGEQVKRESGALEQGRPLYGPVVNLKLYDQSLDLPDAETATQVLASGPIEDMEFDLWFEDDEIVVGLLANPARYDPATLQRHAERLRAFLAALAEAPDAAIGEAPLLTLTETQSIAAWSKGPRIELPEDEVTVLDVLSANARRQPHTTALEDEAQSLDFTEVEQEAARIGRLLIARGIGAGDVVATALPRGADMVIAIVGILASGAAWMPLDPEYPADRLTIMCADARPALILATRAVDIIGYEATILLLDDPATQGELARQSVRRIEDHERRARLTRESLAYLLYTSGSTGTPKGVMVSHGALLNLLHAHLSGIYGATMKRAAGSRIRALHTTSFAFDASWDQIIWMFLGHSLFVCSEEERRDPEALIERARSWKADAIALTPLVLDQLIDCGLLDGAYRPHLLAIGGEPIPPALWERLRAEPGILSQNHYGPVECTVDVTGITVDQASAPVIGRPLANCTVHILDDELRPVPIGVTGELYLAGPGLARGYLGSTRMTASRFIASPFGEGKRMYRTGDLVRWQDGGLIEFVGRRDRQVKIRGMRVEPADVEHALCALPGIDSAVVLAEPFGNTHRLLAWASGSGSAQDWMAALAERLPSYMMPAHIVPVTSWPFTPNGKVDRARLPRPEREATSAHSPACGSPEEQLLCDAMAETLGLPSVSPDADFFRLGGDSIQAMTFSTRLRKAGYRMRPRDIFTLRRPDRMAPALTPLLPVVERVSRAEGVVVPLPIVERFFEQHGEQSQYVQAVAVRVPENLTPRALERAMEALCRAHPALRAELRGRKLHLPPFEAFDAGMVLTLAPPVTDMAAMTDVLDAAFTRSCAHLSPAEGRMMQATFWPGNGAPGWLMIAAHHLVVDGVSWRIILTELAAAAEAAQAGTLPFLAPEETSLADWADELARQVPDRRGEAALWRSAFATPLPGLVRAVNEPLETVGAMGSARLLLDARQTQALLHRLPEAMQANVEEVLLAALGRAWSAVSNVERLRVAMESHGRQDSETADPSRTVGWLTALYPVVIGGIAQGDLGAIRGAKQALRGVPDHGLGYGILRYLDDETGPTLAALETAHGPEVLFNYLGRFSSGEEYWAPRPLTGRFADSFAVAHDPAMRMACPIEFNAFIEEAQSPRLAVQWSWAPSRIDRETIVALHSALGAAIDSFCRLADTDPASASDTLVPAQIAGASEATLRELRERHGPIAALLPLLPLQQGLLFHAQLGAAAGKYNTMTRIALTGRLDMQRLEKALDRVLRRYSQLATRFDADASGALWQVVPAQTGTWPLDLHRLDHLDASEQDEALAAIEAMELARDFTPETGPLIHAALVRLDAERHRLLLNAHHLVVDGWSTPILAENLLAAYREEAELAPLAVTYAEVVTQLGARSGDAARSAWAEVLKGAQPTMLFAGAEAASTTVREFEHRVDARLEQALRARCRKVGVTLNTLMQTVFAGLLSLESGRQDIVFGAPVSGRTSPIEGIESHIGLFSNTLPVRIRLCPEQPLSAQLADVQARQAALIEHDGLTLAELQALAGGETLFDTLFVSEGAPADGDLFARDHAGLRVTSVSNRGFTHYPLTLLMLPGEEMRLLLEVRDTVAKPERLLARLQALLEHVAHDEETPWAAYDPLLADERARIDAANDTDMPVPETTLRACLVEQAERTPDALALVDAEQALTYAQLRAQTCALAMRLRDAGVRRGDLVAVALPRSARLTLALHAVIETGAAYLPLDIGYPDARLELMVEDAQPRLIVTDTGHAARMADWAPVLAFDALAEPQAAEKALSWDSAQAPRPEDPAYCIYTSGSTGRPKGVVVSHKAIVNRLAWMQHAYRLQDGECVLQKTPCSFDVSVWEFFWPLMEGATLVMAPPEAHRDPEATARLIAEHRISTLHFVPSMLAAFLDWIEEDSHERQPLAASLERVFVSGEALSTNLARRHGALLPGQLHNLYGPTEAAVDVTHHTVTGSEDGAGIPIGRPVWNTRLRILDPLLRPCPPGVAGELYLCGVQLADFYRGRSELTATRFVADPMGRGTRMYRTGDIARWRDDGGVDYLGRADDQLKIRGQRIELGEIEAALAALPGIAHAAVQAITLGASPAEADGDARQLVGYVVADSGEVASEGENLRAMLQERLPAHMVPVTILSLVALPLSPNGKLDRKALPRPELATARGRAPRPGTESRIASAFARLLDRPVIGAEDDFFALGGHSLLAMQLAAELRQALGQPVSVGQIMVAPSVAALAALLEQGDALGSPESSGFGPVLYLRGGRGHPLFCFHPASGFAWQYSGLLRHLPAHLPVVGLQSPRPGGVIAASESLDQAAEGQLAAIRRIQPHGPYHLLGYSLGGTLAHGVATKLRAQGEDVAFLGLLDTYPPEGQDWTPPSEEETEAEVGRERGQFLAAMGDQGERETSERGKNAMFETIVANYADSVRLLSQGGTPRFEGTALLYVATRSLPEGWDPQGSWAPFLAAIETERLDCAHTDILSPEMLGTLGPLLAERLAGLQSLG